MGSGCQSRVVDGEQLPSSSGELAQPTRALPRSSCADLA